MASGYATDALLLLAQRATVLPPAMRASVTEAIAVLVSAAEAGTEPASPSLPPVVTLTLTVGGRVAVSQDIPLHPAPVGSGSERR